MGLDDLDMNIASTVRQCSLYLHWGPGHPLAERGPSLESIYRVSLTVYFTTASWGLLKNEKKIRGPGHVPSVPIG